MPSHTQLLIIGAGPYSIATAAYAKSLGLDVTLIGKPLEFWKKHMPRGMFLRSGPDWQIDARETATFQDFLQLRGLTHEQIKPIPLDTFFDYVNWFMQQYEVMARPAYVSQLQGVNGTYHATLDDGSEINADNVLLGLGFAFFKHYPSELVEKLPAGSYSHTCDTVDFEPLRNKRVLMIGGRQSAFEWAALLCEHGAEHVHLSYRHDTPKFTEPDWSWVLPLARRTLTNHAWWRELSAEEQEKIRHDFWAAGRLVLEAWLDKRVHQLNITMHPKTNLAGVTLGEREGGEQTYAVTLDDGTTFNVHHIILATGYRPAMQNVNFLDHATILQDLESADGFPVLDPEFQTTLPNLYITGLAATRDFGPFFGFTVACPIAARIIGEAVAARRGSG